MKQSPLGGQAESWNAAVSQRLALFVLRREQGRLAELEDAIRRSVHEYPALPQVPIRIGTPLRRARPRARCRARSLDELLSHDLAQEYLDAEWLFAMSLLPDVCAFLGDDAAGRLYELLLPYAPLYAEAPSRASLARSRAGSACSRGRSAASTTPSSTSTSPWTSSDACARAHGSPTRSTTMRGCCSAGARPRSPRARRLLAAAVSTYRELAMDVHAPRAAALLAAAGPELSAR